jgi:phosphatidylinositol-bisphosphatase
MLTCLLQGILLPDEVIAITLSAHVNNNIAAVLNMKPKDLSATLILHTMMGKDHFISVSAEYRKPALATRHIQSTELSAQSIPALPISSRG